MLLYFPALCLHVCVHTVTGDLWVRLRVHFLCVSRVCEGMFKRLLSVHTRTALGF